jgi:hypothetical protein
MLGEKFIKKGGERMSSENNPYGHQPIKELQGVPDDEMGLFLRNGFTHGKWDGEELEISRYR